jgi:hypothetical protein
LPHLNGSLASIMIDGARVAQIDAFQAGASIPTAFCKTLPWSSAVLSPKRHNITVVMLESPHASIASAGWVPILNFM